MRSSRTLKRSKSTQGMASFRSGCNRSTRASEIDLDRLLGRPAVKVDFDPICRLIAGETVLVTGAAGTIGSELCRQVLHFAPAQLVCVDHNENGMFYLQMELQGTQSPGRIVLRVSDFGDREGMERILAEHKPSVIFHAAAHKHVPMMESNVYDAVKNNVFGLLQLLELAERAGCAGFVLISSDKAVNPTSVMGATKRIGELMISCRPAAQMRSVSVRFGNVLGSNGSVVQVLQKQLREGLPLTITHPKVTRFFMTLQEAVSLALQAFVAGDHGDTLVLDMGEAVSILELARKLVRLSGRAESGLKFRFTGLRDGEKLSEELHYSTEQIAPTSSRHISRVHGAPYSWAELTRHLSELRLCAPCGSDAQVRAKIAEIVPEYRFGGERAGAPRSLQWAKRARISETARLSLSCD